MKNIIFLLWLSAGIEGYVQFKVQHSTLVEVRGVFERV